MFAGQEKAAQVLRFAMLARGMPTGHLSEQGADPSEHSDSEAMNEGREVAA